MLPSNAGAGAEFGGRFLSGNSEATFRVSAPAATRLELWIYRAPQDAAPILRQPMDRQHDGSFTSTVAMADLNALGLAGTIFYGYRAWGPNWLFDDAWTPGSAAGFVADVDGSGNRFNPNKLLLDPYALEISHTPLTPAYPDPTAYLSGVSFRLVDTGPFAPKGIVIALPEPNFGPKPAGAFKDDVIYEVHLRGLTKNDPAVPANLQGTYAGAALRAAYLRDLGITAVEFQPIHETQNALNDLPQFGAYHNYWGYDSCSFFAPSRRYAADQSPGGPTREWIAMVNAFHAAGLKVYVDLVYNHHGEGGVDEATGSIGSVYSLRGLDNPNYYEPRGITEPNLYEDDNGVGPNVNAATAEVRTLLLDSLQYWTNTMGADGYRFDLAAILGNAYARGGFAFDRDDPDNVLNRTVAELPVRPAEGGAGVDLIAEPYTANGAGQEQGNFPAGWSEWNDRYRNVFRASQNKLGYMPVTPGAIATCLAGSDDLFGARGRKPWNSVNYIVCHDGMTLRDLYSFNGPNNNQPFPFGPSSGGRSAADEMCWDHGGDPIAQRQAVRTGLAILLLSAGTPMLLGGSEINRTLQGNNNSYNLDTSANWIDWSLAAGESSLTNFVRSLLQFRGAHPALRPAEFFTGVDRNGNGVKDLTWYTGQGSEPDADYFDNPDNHFLAYRIDGAEFGDPALSIYIAYNGWVNPIAAVLPLNLTARRWYLVADTAASAETWGNIYNPGSEVEASETHYLVAGRSMALFVEK
jgi:glycogen operon protein